MVGGCKARQHLRVQIANELTYGEGGGRQRRSVNDQVVIFWKALRTVHSESFRRSSRPYSFKPSFPSFLFVVVDRIINAKLRQSKSRTEVCRPAMLLTSCHSHPESVLLLPPTLPQSSPTHTSSEQSPVRPYYPSSPTPLVSCPFSIRIPAKVDDG